MPDRGRSIQLGIFASPDAGDPHLPLSPPPMLAKQAATLDVLSSGRFELGLGAGGFDQASTAMGAAHREPGEKVEALRVRGPVDHWVDDDAAGDRGRHRHVRVLERRGTDRPAPAVGDVAGRVREAVAAQRG